MAIYDFDTSNHRIRDIYDFDTANHKAAKVYDFDTSNHLVHQSGSILFPTTRSCTSSEWTLWNDTVHGEAGSYTVNDTTISLSARSGSGRTRITLSRAINTTAFSTMKVTVSAISSGASSNPIYVHLNDVGGNSVKQLNITSTGTHSISISDINQECDFQIAANYGNTISVTKVWFK